jgi:hypothetical protein
MSHPTLVQPAQKPAVRWGLGRALQGLVALVVAAFVATSATSGPLGCSQQAQCDPSKCANSGNVCVSNLCELECSSHLDCGGQTTAQSCVLAVEDGTAQPVTICQQNGLSPIGAKCPFGNECATALSCPDGSNCDYTQCGGSADGGAVTPGGKCTLDTAACAEVTGCSVGKCPDGSACTVQGCAQSECAALTCLTAGSGDADAYCTLEDCTADSDCPGGYWCEPERDPHQICGQPAPGPDCGMAVTPCVTPSPSNTYMPGPLCTVRNQCRIREQCDPCTTDLDCSVIPGRHCTQVGTSKACTFDCGSDADCVSGYQCTSGECVPRFGSCVGTGKFCEPCQNDTDCGTGLICIAYETGGERVCINPSIACTSDADCPKSPSGLQGFCDPNGGCYIPEDATSMLVSCWCQNTGASCGQNAECCSSKCVGVDAATGQTGNCQ